MNQEFVFRGEWERLWQRGAGRSFPEAFKFTLGKLGVAGAKPHSLMVSIDPEAASFRFWKMISC